MSITFLPTSITITDQTVIDHIASTKSKVSIGKVEVVTGGTPTDVSAAVSLVSLNLHKNSASSFTLLIPIENEASFPIGDEIRIWLGYNVNSTNKFFKIFEGGIKRLVRTHTPMLNKMRVTGFGRAYKLFEADGTQLVTEQVIVCTVTINIIAGEETASSGINILGNKDVPKRFQGKARDAIQQFMDTSNVIYRLAPLDYNVDIQFNFETAMQLIQHILSLSPEPHDWWSDSRAVHIARRKTAARNSASSSSIPGVTIEFVSSGNEAGSGTLTYKTATPCLNRILQWTAPNDSIGAEVVFLEDGTLQLFSRDDSMWINVTVVYALLPKIAQTDSITITADTTPIPVDITLTGTQFRLLERDKSGEVDPGHLARFITNFNPYLKIDSVVRLSSVSIGADRDILIDAISISYSPKGDLIMDCKGEVI